jgi:hypothetical protein
MQCLRCLRTFHNIGHHARAFFQIYKGYGVWAIESWMWALVDYIAG